MKSRLEGGGVHRVADEDWYVVAVEVGGVVRGGVEGGGEGDSHGGSQGGSHGGLGGPVGTAVDHAPGVCRGVAVDMGDRAVLGVVLVHVDAWTQNHYIIFIDRLS